MGDEVDNFEQFAAELDNISAQILQRAALAVQQAAIAAYRAGSNPPPYANPAPKGTFPHVRTGNLASSIVIRPTTLAEIKRKKRVRIGYLPQAFYGVALGERGWKWLQDVLDMARAQIQASINGVARISRRGGIR